MPQQGFPGRLLSVILPGDKTRRAKRKKNPGGDDPNPDSAAKAANAAGKHKRRGEHPAAPRPVRHRGGRPLVFAPPTDGIALQFHGIGQGEMSIVLRILAPTSPDALTVDITYHAEMGTEIGAETLVLRSSNRALEPLTEEMGLGHLALGRPYRASGSISIPAHARGAVATIKAPDGQDPGFILLQSARIQPRGEHPSHTDAAYASHAYLRLSSPEQSTRITLKFLEKQHDQHNYSKLILPDVIGTGPAVCRMRRFDATGSEIAPSAEEPHGRDGRTLIAMPRVRMLESPSRSGKFLPLDSAAIETAELEIAMIQGGTEGFVDLLATQFSFHGRLPSSPSRAGLDRIAADFYRKAHALSDDDLIRLRF